MRTDDDVWVALCNLFRSPRNDDDDDDVTRCVVQNISLYYNFVSRQKTKDLNETTAVVKTPSFMSLEFWTTFVFGSYDDDDDDDVVKLKALSIFYPKNPTTRKIERSLSLLFFVSDTLNVKNSKSV